MSIMAVFLAGHDVHHELAEAEEWPLCSHGSLRQPQARAGLARACIWPDLWPIFSLYAGKEGTELLILSWLPIFLHCMISHVPIVSK